MRRFLAGVVAVLLPLVALPAAAATWSSAGFVKADKVLVVKSERRLYLLQDGSVVRSFRVALGPNPLGPKMFAGDGRTPEGLYVLDWRNVSSRFYRAIHISYPSDDDAERALQFGGNPGGLIMVHGQPIDGFNGHNPYFDWTEGCIALSNQEMDEVWMAVDDGTLIEILP